MRAKLPLLAIALVTACGRPETDVAGAERLPAAQTDSVALASARFDASIFDTIVWPAAADRLNRGRVVWQFSCQKCHGAEGRGDGELAQAWEIEVPVIVAGDWPYAGDIDAIRYRVFVGHTTQMPNWGLHGLKYRDIDAVAIYMSSGLRGGREPGP